jgi:hypothetical protein
MQLSIENQKASRGVILLKGDNADSPTGREVQSGRKGLHRLDGCRYCERSGAERGSVASGDVHLAKR